MTSCGRSVSYWCAAGLCLYVATITSCSLVWIVYADRKVPAVACAAIIGATTGFVLGFLPKVSTHCWILVLFLLVPSGGVASFCALAWPLADAKLLAACTMVSGLLCGGGTGVASAAYCRRGSVGAQSVDSESLASL